MSNIQKALIAWSTAIAISIAIVKLTSIGPVILTISETYGMGVHSFDLITVIPISIAFMYSLRVLKTDPVIIEIKK